MRCPSCGQENEASATFCLRCGTRLQPGGDPAARGTGESPAQGEAPSPPAARQPLGAAPPPTSGVPPAGPEPPPPNAPPEGSLRSADATISHRGQVFALGYGPDHYAVWDLRTAGDPVARFESTTVGWEAAWRRFHELEAGHAVPGWRRPGIGWILLHIAIGLFGVAFAQGFLLGFVWALSGRSVDRLSAATGAGLGLATLTGLTAWLLFVYLRTSTAVRFLVFAAVLAAGFTAALVMGFSAQPATL